MNTEFLLSSTNERGRDVRLLRDATTRPIDRAGDVRLDLGAMTTQGQMQLFRLA